MIGRVNFIYSPSANRLIKNNHPGGNPQPSEADARITKKEIEDPQNRKPTARHRKKAKLVISDKCVSKSC